MSSPLSVLARKPNNLNTKSDVNIILIKSFLSLSLQTLMRIRAVLFNALFEPDRLVSLDAELATGALHIVSTLFCSFFAFIFVHFRVLGLYDQLSSFRILFCRKAILFSKSFFFLDSWRSLLEMKIQTFFFF